MGQRLGHGSPLRRHRRPRGLGPNDADSGRRRPRRGTAPAVHRPAQRLRRPHPGGGRPLRQRVLPESPVQGRQHLPDRPSRHHLARRRHPGPVRRTRGQTGAAAPGSRRFPGQGRDGGLPRAQEPARLGRRHAAAGTLALQDHRHDRRERTHRLPRTGLLRGRLGAETHGLLPGAPADRVWQTGRDTREDRPGAAAHGPGRVRGAADPGRRVHRRRRPLRRRAPRPPTGRAAPGRLGQPHDPADRGGRSTRRSPARPGHRHRLLPPRPSDAGLHRGAGRERLAQLPRSLPVLAALVAVAIPAAAVLVTLLAMRGVVVEPLGVVRTAKQRRRRLWWRLLPPLAASRCSTR